LADSPSRLALRDVGQNTDGDRAVMEVFEAVEHLRMVPDIWQQRRARQRVPEQIPTNPLNERALDAEPDDRMYAGRLLKRRRFWSVPGRRDYPFRAGRARTRGELPGWLIES
jgi:hypothetical protein